MFLIALAGILPKNWITLGFDSHFKTSSAHDISSKVIFYYLLTIS